MLRSFTGAAWRSYVKARHTMQNDQGDPLDPQNVRPDWERAYLGEMRNRAKLLARPKTDPERLQLERRDADDAFRFLPLQFLIDQVKESCNVGCNVVQGPGFTGVSRRRAPWLGLGISRVRSTSSVTIGATHPLAPISRFFRSFRQTPSMGAS